MSAPTVPPAIGPFGFVDDLDEGASEARPLLLTGREPEASEIAMPRFAALASGVLAFGAASASAMMAGRPEWHLISMLPVALPLVLAASAVGVGRLADWLPSAWQQWQHRVSYALVTPYLAVMLFTAAVPTLTLPLWIGPVVGALAAAPFLRAGMGRQRLRARVVAASDAYGRRGARLAAASLVLIVYSIVRPDYGSFLSVVLLLALTVAAFATRGLADAGLTWGVVTWSALVWGALVCWAAAVATVSGPWLDSAAAHVLTVVAASLPLAASSFVGRLRRPR